MTEWQVRPKHNLTVARTQSGFSDETTRLQPNNPQSSQRIALPAPKSKEVGPGWWHLPAVVLFELVMLALHYGLVEETIQTVGIEINKIFAEDVLVGWLFQAIPQLTARELLAAVTAVFFVGVPIVVWLNILDDEARTDTLAGMIVRTFLLSTYAFILVGEALMVWHRLSLGRNNVFGTQSGHEPNVAVFFGLLFCLINMTAAFATASLYRRRKSGSASP